MAKENVQIEKPIVLEALKLLYEENGRNNRYLVDWRHKVLVRFFVVNAAFLYVAKWLWESGQQYLQSCVWVPFLLTFCISLVFYLMDIRNLKLINLCARIGMKLESEIGSGIGFYSGYLKLNQERDGKIKRPLSSFTTAFRVIYLGNAFISIVLALILYITNCF